MTNCLWRMSALVLFCLMAWPSSLIANANTPGADSDLPLLNPCEDEGACNYGEAADCLYDFGPGVYYVEWMEVNACDESYMIADVEWDEELETYAGVLEIANGTNLGDSFDNVAHFVTLTISEDAIEVVYGGSSVHGYTDEVGGFTLSLGESTPDGAGNFLVGALEGCTPSGDVSCEDYFINDGSCGEDEQTLYMTYDGLDGKPHENSYDIFVEGEFLASGCCIAGYSEHCVPTGACIEIYMYDSGGDGHSQFWFPDGTTTVSLDGEVVATVSGNWGSEHVIEINDCSIPPGCHDPAACNFEELGEDVDCLYELGTATYSSEWGDVWADDDSYTITDLTLDLATGGYAGFLVVFGTNPDGSFNPIEHSVLVYFGEESVDVVYGGSATYGYTEETGGMTFPIVGTTDSGDLLLGALECIETGCMDETACNFDEEALDDDGSCVYALSDGTCEIYVCGYDGEETVTFTKDDYADPFDEANQDRITPTTWVTRADSEGLFNAALEEGFNGDGPLNTVWDMGPTTDPNATYMSWVDAVDYFPPGAVDVEMSLHLIAEDLYFDVVFHSWTEMGQGGGFSYTRTINYELSGCGDQLVETGCMDPIADNYSPTANVDDGSCMIWSCGDYALAQSFAFSKADYANPNDPNSQDRITDLTWITRGNIQGIYNAKTHSSYNFCGPSNTEWKLGPVSEAGTYVPCWQDAHGLDPLGVIGNYMSMHLIEEDLYFDVITTTWTSLGLGGGFSYVRNLDTEASGCTLLPLVYGCKDAEAVNFNPDASVSDGSCQYSGCTDPEACNFDATAEVDDGSCTSVCPGCTDAIAANFDPSATEDDGSCMTWSCGYLGPETVEFSKTNYADPFLDENQDRITHEVWITRGDNMGLFNAFNQTGHDYCGPLGTDWKLGPTDEDSDVSGNTYGCWTDAVNWSPPNAVGSELSLYIEDEDLYFDVMMTSWTAGGSATNWEGGGGGFTYTRTLNAELSGCELIPLIYGCMDTEAANFDGEATVQDDSCIYPGCMDPEACNFDAGANEDDGSCTDICPGCTTPIAFNYLPNANVDDGSCMTFADCGYDGDDEVVFTFNADTAGVIAENIDILSPSVHLTFDKFGPMNTLEQNYSFNLDPCGPPGTEWKVGTTDEEGEYGCFFPLVGEHINFMLDVSPHWSLHVIEEDLYFDIEILGLFEDTFTGADDISSITYRRTLNAELSGCTAIPLIAGCTDPTASNFNPDANGDDGSCAVSGCTDPTACNFNAEANEDDGTCSTECGGCTHTGAVNFDPLATYDDGSCLTLTCGYEGSLVSDAALWNDLDGLSWPTPEYQDSLVPGLTIGLHHPNMVNVENSVYPAESVCGPIGVQFKNGSADSGGDWTCWKWMDFHDATPYSMYLAEHDLYFDLEIDGFIYNYGFDLVEYISWTRTLNLEMSGCELVPLVEGCIHPDAANFDSEATYDDGTCLIPGCMEPEYCNYNPEATITDNSCTGLCAGCTEPSAANFDPGATEDDGSCLLFDGCGYTGPESVFVSYDANNYEDPSAFDVLTESNSLAFDACGVPFNATGSSSNFEWKAGGPEEPGDFFANWFYAWDGTWVETHYTLHLIEEDLYFDIELHEHSWDQLLWACNFLNVEYTRTFAAEMSGCAMAPLVEGCTDASAPNFECEANFEDGSCGHWGCTYPSADNYDAEAMGDDGSCAFSGSLGCTEPSAPNFDPTASMDDGSCQFVQCAGYTGPHSVTFVKENYADWTQAAHQDWITSTVGIARKDNQGLFNAHDQSGYTGGAGGPSNTEWHLGTTADGGTWANWVTAVENNPAVNCNDSSLMSLRISDSDLYFDLIWLNFTGGNNGGGFSYIRTINMDMSGCSWATPTPGCTQPMACNYDPAANADDGSCSFADCGGCMYPDALNYNSMAQWDDGSCLYCSGDLNADGIVSTGDLLMLLSSFATTCE